MLGETSNLLGLQSHRKDFFLNRQDTEACLISESSHRSGMSDLSSYTGFASEEINNLAAVIVSTLLMS